MGADGKSREEEDGFQSPRGEDDEEEQELLEDHGGTGVAGSASGPRSPAGAYGSGGYASVGGVRSTGQAGLECDEEDFSDYPSDSDLIPRMYTAEERAGALKRTAGSIVGSVLFGLIVVSLMRPPEAVMNYFTCYIMEVSLSFDNVFAFYLVFKYFRTPKVSMQRCLYWGWLTALAFRGALIFTLGEGVLHYKWLLAIFVPVLIFQGVRAVQGLDEYSDDQEDLSSSNRIVRFATYIVPVTNAYYEDRFFVRSNATRKLLCTPLFLTLVVIELTDVVFCVDSVPAQFAITSDTFLIFWAVAFALLCLRSFFVLLSQFVSDMPVLQRYIGAILIFIGFRLSLEVAGLEVPPWLSLCIVLGTIAGGAAAAAREKHRRENGLDADFDDADDQNDGAIVFLNSSANQGGVEEDELE